MWYQTVTSNLEDKQIINDSKTPSGRVHVGSLRGILIHDAIYRNLQQNGHKNAVYLYGIDDYDPMDGLPADATADMKQHMGKPLCMVPSPQPNSSDNIADYYAEEFINIFQELGVNAQFYKTSELYRSGKFNDAIATILDNAATVRTIYKQVSGSEKGDDWYPFQVICESCGNIGTTKTIGYHDGIVKYRCVPDLVSWAQGCGHSSSISPFNGNGKLPWKLEWTAKWSVLGVTIEGAGKDHCTKGGSHDIASRCLQVIFKKKAPVSVPYEFFLVSGAKMSSSKGVGTSAREMADFLPATVLRHLLIRTPPKRTVNFSTSQEYIIKLFNEYDQLTKQLQQSDAGDDVISAASMIQISQKQPLCHQEISFQLIIALLQLPHVDIYRQLEKRYSISAQQKIDLEKRIASAQYWLEHFAREEERVELQQQLPHSAQSLTNSQKALLYLVAQLLPKDVSEDDYQQHIFDCARLVPIDVKSAFAALYCVLLDKTQGPKGGSLLAYIAHDFLYDRLTNLTVNLTDFLAETATSEDALMRWLDKNLANISICRTYDIHYFAKHYTQLILYLHNGQKLIMRLAPHQTLPDILRHKCTSPQTHHIDNTNWKDSWHILTDAYS